MALTVAETVFGDPINRFEHEFVVDDSYKAETYVMPAKRQM